MFMGTSMVSEKRPHMKNYQENQEKRTESSWLILKDETALQVPFEHTAVPPHPVKNTDQDQWRNFMAMIVGPVQVFPPVHPTSTTVCLKIYNGSGGFQARED